MKKVKFLLFSFVGMFFLIGNAYAQELLVATVTTGERYAKIEFSKRLLPDGEVEFYRVVKPAESEMLGDSQLIKDLYMEPALLAQEVRIKGFSIELFFRWKNPDKKQRANILNRIIVLTHKNIAPTMDLEINGYNPLDGAISPAPRYYIPMPRKIGFQKYVISRPSRENL